MAKLKTFAAVTGAIFGSAQQTENASPHHRMQAYIAFMAHTMKQNKIEVEDGIIKEFIAELFKVVKRTSRG